MFKVLIKLYVPEIDEIYEMYIPINKTVGDVSYSLCCLINKLSKVYPIKNNAILLNRDSGEVYNRDITIRESSIRNGTQLILF